MRIHCTTIFAVYLGLGCAASFCAAPTITGVTNSASALPPGLPNSGVAQGSIFAVYGSALGPSALVEVQSYPLPTTQGLAGTTVKVTVGSVTETCIMFYTLSTQVAAVLPSATPLGSGTLTVSYQGQSASIPIQVLTAGFGTYTLNEDGSGPAVVTDPYYHPITLVNPAHPGDNLVLWGTGLGAVSGDETQPPVEVDLHTGVQVFVGNQPAAVLYGGRSGDAGLDQINFTVPTGVSPGCRTSIAVLVKGVVGNVTTMAVAPAGQSTCGDAIGPLTTANLQKAVATGSLNLAEVSLTRFSPGDDYFTGQFLNYPLSSLVRSYGGTVGASVGSCTAYEFQGPLQVSSLIIADPIQPPGLDAGSTITVTGPNGTRTSSESSTGAYSSILGTSSAMYVTPGSYTVSNANGGAGMGAFNLALTLPAPIGFTNFPATINRARDLTLTWTDSSAFSAVSIIGYTGVPLSLTTTAYVEFFCSAPASAGQFTIPSVILSLLPANGYSAHQVPGVGIEISGVALTSFTVTGSPGIDAGVFTAFTASGGSATVQ